MATPPFWCTTTFGFGPEGVSVPGWAPPGGPTGRNYMPKATRLVLKRCRLLGIGQLPQPSVAAGRRWIGQQISVCHWVLSGLSRPETR